MSQIVTNCHRSQGNTKPDSRVRRVCFTLNNYTDDEVVTLSHYFEEHGKYIIGKEVGEEGTPHLQGYVEFKGQKRFSTLKKLNQRIHWEKARGNRDQNIRYCSKENNYIYNIKNNKLRNDEIMRDEYENVKWKKWQQDVLDIIDSKPDNRKVHWFYEHEGNTGKSFLCKYIDLKHDVIIAGGKKADIFNQVKVHMDADKDPTIIILDVPRDTLDYINYGAIESLKNGHIYSGKYEGGKCIFKIPHVIVFANEGPDRSKMSSDRWDIRII